MHNTTFLVCVDSADRGNLFASNVKSSKDISLACIIAWAVMLLYLGELTSLTPRVFLKLKQAGAELCQAQFQLKLKLVLGLDRA